MSYRIEKPKLLLINDMFLWWCKSKIKNKRHMDIRHEKSHGKDTILVSANKDELAWLREHILVLDEQIIKIEAQEKSKPYFTKRLEKMYEMKSEIIESNKRIEELEQADPNGERIVMSDRKFKAIIYCYNKKAVAALVSGKIINMKQYMGFLYVNKIPRNHPDFVIKGSAIVNWAESFKYKKELIAKGEIPRSKEQPEGKNWLVHYTDDYFLKYTWTKKSGACRVKNHGFYGFYPAKATKKNLARANDENKLLHKRYVKKKIYYPRLKKEAA